MKHLIHFLERNLSGKKVLSLFVLTNIIYLVMLLVTIPMTMEFAEGRKLLDMLPTGYDWDYVNELFGALGNEGRNVYLTRQIPVDMIYPFLFAISYSLLLTYFLKKLNRLRVPYTYLCLLPFIAGAADYLENLGIITMLLTYPNLSEDVSMTTAVFSLIKSIFSTLFFVTLIISLFAVGLQALQKRRANRNSGAGIPSAR